MGLIIKLNEELLELDSNPVFPELLCFWKNWTYHVIVPLDSIESVQIKRVFGIPTAIVVVKTQEKKVRLLFSMARASREALYFLYHLNCPKEISNTINLNKYLAAKGLPSFWSRSISVEKKYEIQNLTLAAVN